MMYTRKLDKLRRVVLPPEVSSFGWRKETELDIELMSDEKVLVSLHKPICQMCGESKEDLIKIANKNA